MEDLLFVAVIVIVAVALGIGLVRATRKDKRQSMPGRFDFDSFKTRELNNRGVHDKTKWD